MKTKLFTLLLTVAASVGTMFASNTQVNGIWYDFDSSNRTATVTYRGASYSAYNEYTGSVVIPASVSLHRYIDIENRELNDPVSVTISCPGGKAVIICTTSHREPAREVDITRFLGS